MRPFATHQVLVVESDPWLQHAVARWIEGAGLECLPVSAPDEALALVQEEEADVAIVSGSMEAWTPAHLAHALQSRDADLPVIVVRPSGETARGFRGRRGAVEEIEAPLTRGSVMSAVHRALEWRDATPDDRARYRELERSVFSQATLLRDACHSEPCTEAGLTSAFTAFLDRRLPGAAGHAARTRVIALELATAIGMDAAASHVVGQAATLHELGLALLPQPLRQPADTLTGLDRVLALRHPDVVFELLSSMPGLAHAAAVVRACTRALRRRRASTRPERPRDPDGRPADCRRLRGRPHRDRRGGAFRPGRAGRPGRPDRPRRYRARPRSRARLGRPGRAHAGRSLAASRIACRRRVSDPPPPRPPSSSATARRLLGQRTRWGPGAFRRILLLVGALVVLASVAGAT